jgi:hypothetical protein
VIAAVRPNLGEAECRELEELLNEYGDIFAMDNDEYERDDRMYHRIDTVEARPIRPLQRSLPNKEADVGKMLEDMHQSGVIKESNSPWPSPSFSSGRRTGTCASA